MVRVVSDAELALDDFGDTRPRPDIAEEAEGRRAARQERRQFSQLVGREAGRRARRCAGAQGLHAASTGTFEPLANGTLGDAEGFGNLALLPALMMEFPGTETTAFAPILWISGPLHDQYATIGVVTVLGLYAGVSRTPVKYSSIGRGASTPTCDS